MTGVNPLYFIVGMALLGLAPFFLMMVTSYVKIVVVTSLVRNALGVQQVPPAEGQESGDVVQVFQKGYKIGDKIIRHATVVVAE